MVTAATYQKQPLFSSVARLTVLADTLLLLAEQTGWRLQAWAVFPNHYHFIGENSEAGAVLRLVRSLHASTAAAINHEDKLSARKVWFQYWESRLTYAKSYFARLSYVHQNAVHHGIVRVPSRYPWCSAGWFERRAPKSLYRRIMEFKPARLQIPDDFEVSSSGLGLEP
jgi:putative transposase